MNLNVRRIIISSVIAFAVIYMIMPPKEVIVKNEKKLKKKVVKNKKKSSKRLPASIKPAEIKSKARKDSASESFNKEFPPPSTDRSIAKIVDHFSSFDQVKKSYQVSGKKMLVEDYILHESAYLTYPDDGTFTGEMGQLIKTMYGYVIYLPKNPKEAKKGNNHLYIDEHTWQPTVITGRLFVSYDPSIKGHEKYVKDKVEDLGHKIVNHLNFIKKYEIEVKDRNKTLEYKREIASKIEGVKVETEFKNTEHVPH